MVEQNFFASPHEVMETPRVLSESDWQKDQFLMGIKRLKANKPADEIKHVAELLYFVFNDFFDWVLEVLYSLLHSLEPIDRLILVQDECQMLSISFVEQHGFGSGRHIEKH